MHIFAKMLFMSVLKKNKAFFVFLIKFGVTYLVLSLIYWAYLQQFNADAFEPDSMTTTVTRQAEYLVNLLGKNASIVPHTKEASWRFLINGKSVARIVEGCNAISVMILFTAFIIAFSSTFKRTTLFILAGLIIIHLLNVIRIALLCLSFYYYPQYNDLMHDILFPLFIYGVVFILWIIWVQKFAINANR